MVKKKSNKTYLVPKTVPYNNTLIYKEIAKELGINWKVVEFVVRTDYKLLRTFINTTYEKGKMFARPSLGRFVCMKNVESEENRNIRIQIECIINRYINLHINEDDVKLLKEWQDQGHRIPYAFDIFDNGRRRIRKQLISPDLRPYLPDDYFIKHGAVWLQPPKVPEIAPEDSVMEKFKDDDFLKSDSEMDVF